MIAIEPEFYDGRAEQGVKGWSISLDLPALTGSKKQIKWAEAIRRESLLAFIEMTMRIGGASSIWTRHWWDDDLQSDLRRVTEELNAGLGPMLAETTHSPEWINALSLDRNVRDEAVIFRLLTGSL